MLHKRIAKACFISFVVTQSIVNIACSRTTNDWPEKPSQEDSRNSLQIWLPLAKAGNVQAQFYIANLYSNGLGVEKDSKQATYWFYQAALQGHVDAQTSLGWSYHIGNGVNPDQKTFVYWTEKAADKGGLLAINNLAIAYSEGQGVSRNPSRAFELYKLAAQKGLAMAQSNLGFMYDTGTGVTENHSEAVFWFRKAAEQSDPQGEMNLGAAYFNGSGVPVNYEQSFYWTMKAANHGNARAQYHAGMDYENGYGTNKDITKARYWYSLAADKNIKEAEDALLALNARPEVTEPQSTYNIEQLYSVLAALVLAAFGVWMYKKPEKTKSLSDEPVDHTKTVNGDYTWQVVMVNILLLAVAGLAADRIGSSDSILNAKFPYQVLVGGIFGIAIIYSSFSVIITSVLYLLSRNKAVFRTRRCLIISAWVCLLPIIYGSFLK